MAYQPLHHKYRPQRLAELVGQQAIATTLANALRTGRIAPAYLFWGPRGPGKTSSARLVAGSRSCFRRVAPRPVRCGQCEVCGAIPAGKALEGIEIDAASNTGVDNIRELIERSRFAPVQARWKVYVIDECHMLSTAAFNALLKTLEEPPPRVVFVLATTDPQRVLPTILSRCQRFDFRRISLADLEGHLGWIAAQESIAISAEALNLVAQRAQGGLRDAESLLDQLSLLAPPLEAAAVWDLLGAVPEQELLSLADSMAAAEPLAVIETCRQLLERGREPLALLQGLASLLRDLLLAGIAPDRLELNSVSPQLRPELPPVARRIGKNRLLQWQAQLKGSEQQLRQSVQPRLWLEVLLLGLLAEPQGVAAAPAGSAAAGSARAGSAAASAQAPASGGANRSADASAPAAAAAMPPQAQPPTAPARATAAAPAPAAAQPPAAASAAGSTAEGGLNLPDLWQQILAGLELPSTRMLLSQQAQLVHLDDHRLVVRVAGTWMAMVQNRQALLQKAITAALGQPRQLVLEAGQENAAGVGGGRASAAAVASAAPAPPAPPPSNTPGQAAVQAPAPVSGSSWQAEPSSPPPGTAFSSAAVDASAAAATKPPASSTESGPAAGSAAGLAANTAPATAPSPGQGPAGDQSGANGQAEATPAAAAVAQTPTAQRNTVQRNSVHHNSVQPNSAQPNADSSSQPASAAAGQAPAPGVTPPRSPLDDKARRLAEFFNGEIVDLDEPLTDLHDAA
ncbi:MAG: DNA polymerase III subunit gamma/tau [Synechococcaceae cyanobacterium]